MDKAGRIPHLVLGYHFSRTYTQDRSAMSSLSSAEVNLHKQHDCVIYLDRDVKESS